MTEFSTNNDISRQTHQTQPLHTSPHQPLNRHHYQQPSPLQHQHNNSPQHNLTHHGIHHQLPNLNNHLTFKQTQNHKNNQQTLTLNSSANINPRSPIISPTSATHSSAVPYKKPLNSPNNSPFAYAYYGAQQLQHQQHLPIASTAATTQHQQQLRLLHSKLSQTNYQQHLNDLLLQQQQLHQQQQQVLNAAGGAKKDEAGVHDELSDECLKQNVAIVLNNLDRYNNALRSVILNEQVNNSLFDDSVLDLSSISSNNNFLLSGSSKMATPATPESDYNSNATTPGSRVGSNMLPTQQHLQQLQQQQNQQHDNVVGFATSAACGFGAGGNLRSGGGGWDGVGGGINGAGSNLNCSLASSHDFSHDNSDYQWFLDYGYRDGCGMQRSVLSSLSASYNGIGELYYDDLAKNIDANLAEVDIESFRAEDIHSLLSRLPSYCKTLGGGGSIGLGANCRLQQHGSQISSSSTNELIDNSICKSELLFSPVKESHISVDSLDLDAYPDEGDIILTCKANKDNYTIAFEGSIIYSDESCYAEPNEVSLKNKQNCINLHSNLDDIVKRKSLDVSMSRSDHQMTTWSKLKKGNVLQRYPSGNNNTADHGAPTLHAPCTVRKSSSLPNLQSKTDAPSCNRQQLNVSHVSTSTLDSCRLRNLLPMCQMPISCSSTTASTSDRVTQRCLRQPSQQLQHNQPQQQQRQHHHHHHRQQEQQQQHHYHHQHAQLQAHDSSSSAASASSATQQKHQSGNGNTTCGTSATSSNQPALNLVKLFIKQKSSSSSTDGENHASAHTCMDVSSGCWPSSDAAGSGGSSSSFEQRLRKKSMNDSGKGSALSRHDEEDTLCCAGGCREDAVGVGQSYVVDAGGGGADNEREKHDVFYEEDRTLTSSPAAQRRLSVPPRHPQVRQLTQRHQKNSNSNNNGSSESSLQLSDASHSNSEPLTQVFMSSAANKDSRSTDRENESIMHKENNVTQCHDSTSSEMITRSMQTSCGTLSTRSSLSERFRFVPPSFLSKLNNLGEEKQAPIYVIYPNYALPDLDFVKTTNTPDVIFSPFNFKTPLEGGVNAASAKDRFSEDEILKNIDYKHIIDWKSLVTLLPTEYRKRLQHIPEVGSLNLEQGGDDPPQKPLFCMSPPIRRPQRSAHMCDCAHFFQQAAQTQREGSSSSGSSQQPSSGYRGSSTILTDSELGDTPAVATSDPLKQMYVYQYEQHQRTDSGVDSPSAHSPASKPTPQPRGILRKTNPPRGGARNKRNSMFEEQHAKLTKQEKRRSLQEPAYNHYLAGGSGSMDELYDALPEEEVFEENLVQAYFAGMTQANQRLSRKDLDARARAENFLSSLPRSELKYYAEIAAILESSEEQQQAAAVQYDAAALKKEVSRVLSQQKKVSFNENEQLLHPQPPHQQQQTQQQLLPTDARHKRFSTPPNSPNISMASGLRMPPNSAPRRCSQLDAYSSKRKPTATIDAREQMKLTSNRFKRLQIQWELLSNDSSMMLKDLASEQETKSGSSTPTQTAGDSAGHRSRIPRPVSYPAGRRVSEPLKPPKVSVKPVPNKGFAKIVKPVVSPRIARVTQHGQQDTSKAATATRSPSRIVQPKRYSISSPTAATATSPGTSRVTTPTSGMPSVVSRARTPTSRPATAATAPNTPKRRVQSPRTIPRVR